MNDRKGKLFAAILLLFLTICLGQSTVVKGEESFSEPEPVVLRSECKASGSTEVFTYDVTVDDEVILTGFTEDAKKDKKNRRLTMPNSIDGMDITGIADGAFAGMPLTKVAFPGRIREIGIGAFYGCNLEKVTIPRRVTYIGPRAFGANHCLREIDVLESNQTYCTDSGVLYNKEMTILLQMPSYYKSWSYPLPDSVEVIGEYAFGNCRYVKRIYTKYQKELEIREKAFWNTDATIESLIGPKKTVGRNTDTLYYNFADFKREMSYELDYQVNANNSLSIQFEKINRELRMNCTDLIDLQYCTEIAFKLKNEVGRIALNFYNEEGETVLVLYPEITSGTEEFVQEVHCKETISSIGVMSCDEDLLDYSQFDTILYWMRLQFYNSEEEAVTYDFNDLTYQDSYYMDYDVKEDGSVDVEFHKLYGEAIWMFPETLDMKKYTEVAVKMKNEDGKLTVKFYDEELNQVEIKYDCKTDGIEAVLVDPSDISKIAGIGLMGDGADESDFSPFAGTVYEVKFYRRK